MKVVFLASLLPAAGVSLPEARREGWSRQGELHKYLCRALKLNAAGQRKQRSYRSRSKSRNNLLAVPFSKSFKSSSEHGVQPYGCYFLLLLLSVSGFGHAHVYVLRYSVGLWLATMVSFMRGCCVCVQCFSVCLAVCLSAGTLCIRIPTSTRHVNKAYHMRKHDSLKYVSHEDHASCFRCVRCISACILNFLVTHTLLFILCSPPDLGSGRLFLYTYIHTYIYIYIYLHIYTLHHICRSSH